MTGWLILPIAPGLHQWDLQLKDLGHYLYYIHIGAIIYGISIFFIKVSILLQYLQIFVSMGCSEPRLLDNARLDLIKFCLLLDCDFHNDLCLLTCGKSVGSFDH